MGHISGFGGFAAAPEGAKVANSLCDASRRRL